MNNRFNLNEEEKSRIRALHGIKVLNEQGSGSDAPEDTTAENPQSCAAGYRWNEKVGECVSITPEWFLKNKNQDIQNMMRNIGRDIDFVDIVQSSVEEVINEFINNLQEKNDDLNRLVFNRGRVDKKKLEAVMNENPRFLLEKTYKALSRIFDIERRNSGNYMRLIKDMNKKINEKINYRLSDIVQNKYFEDLLYKLGDQDMVRKIQRDIELGLNKRLMKTDHFNNTKLTDVKKRLETLFDKALHPDRIVGNTYLMQPIESSGVGVKLPILTPTNFLSKLGPAYDDKYSTKRRNKDWLNWLIGKINSKTLGPNDGILATALRNNLNKEEIKYKVT